MEEKKVENPRVFPIFDDAGICQDGQEGMTLRDYFAAKAMQARLMVSYSADGEKIVDDINIANEAYRIADAMLNQRTK